MSASAMLRGLVGGVLATAPMTLTMFLMRRIVNLPKESEKLPPQEITENVMENVNAMTPAEIPEAPVRETRGEFSWPTVIAHYGYGGMTGALYPVLMKNASAPPLVKGMLYGTMVWSGSYLGFLPAAKLYPKASEKSPSLNLLMITAHLVWGGALGWFCGRRDVKTALI